MTQTEYEANTEMDYALHDILDRVAEKLSVDEARILAMATGTTWTSKQEIQSGKHS